MAFNIVTELGNQYHNQVQNISKKTSTPIAATLITAPQKGWLKATDIYCLRELHSFLQPNNIPCMNISSFAHPFINT